MKIQANSLLKCLGLILFVPLLGIAQKKNIASSMWTNRGSIENQEIIPRESYQYDKSNNLLYLVTNDDNYCYINLLFLDQNSVHTIMRRGLTTWIDPSGKNKKAMGVQFPVMPERDNQEARGQRSNDRSQEMKPELPSNLEIELLNFAGVDRINIPTHEPNQVDGRIMFNEYNEMLYTVAIPYRMTGAGSLINKTISINIESVAMDSALGSQARGMQGQGGPGGGPRGGGPPGGGQRGGGSGPPGGQNATDNSINLKIKRIRLVNEIN